MYPCILRGDRNAVHEIPEGPPFGIEEDMVIAVPWVNAAKPATARSERACGHPVRTVLQ